MANRTCRRRERGASLGNSTPHYLANHVGNVTAHGSALGFLAPQGGVWDAGALFDDQARAALLQPGLLHAVDPGCCRRLSPWAYAKRLPRRHTQLREIKCPGFRRRGGSSRPPTYEVGDARGAIALAFFRRLHALEERYKEQCLSAEQRLKQRRELSIPIVDEFCAWVDEMHPQAVQGTSLYKATNYATNQRAHFRRCFEDGRFEIDNGAVERELRRIRIGEKNYLFAGSDAGAQRLADVFTVLATCRTHGVNPQDYLTDVVRKIQNGWPKSRIAELMPESWQAERTTKNAASSTQAQLGS